jgi:beta-glucosidase
MNPNRSPWNRISSTPACCGLLLIGIFALGQRVAASQSPSQKQTPDARVDGLLSQMTLEEKLALIRGAHEPAATNQAQAGYLTGVPRLCIPPLRLADGPPGVLTRLPSQAETATMGLAATFSVHDAEENGKVVAREAKSLGIDVVLQPFINIDRDITFARGYNTYGEDPVLTGLMGASFIHGVQGEGVMSQAKHFVGYDTDGADVTIGDQALHEVYLAPFLDAVQAGVSSIMCSYNSINGAQACGNADTLEHILRDEMGFTGFVTSDWGAVHNADYIGKGLDMEMPGPAPKGNPLGWIIFSFFTTENPNQLKWPRPTLALLAGFTGSRMPEEPPLKPFVLGAFGTMHDSHINFWNLLQKRHLDQAAIDRAARNVLLQYEKFGFLDHKTPGQLGPKDPPVHDVEANATVIEKTAEDSAVLLKNDGQILPLKAEDSVAMIGPGAGQMVAIGVAGERSIGFPWRQIGTVDAMAKIAPGVKVTYAVEDEMTGVAIPAEFLSHDGKPGLERGTNQTREANGERTKTTDALLEFTAKTGNTLPANGDIVWEGKLNVPTSGSYWIYLQLLGAAGDLTIDGKHIAGANGMRGAVHGDTVLGGKDGLMPTSDGLDNVRAAVQLSSGSHKLKVSITGDTSNAPEQVRLAWVTPEQRKANHDAAIAAAKSAKTAVVFAWSRGKYDFVLPGNGKDYDQNKLIEEIAAVNPNTVVVLNISQPVAMPWLSKVKGVLQMWWPGDEGGWATANVLLGKTNPAGRLPFTWAKKLTDYAATDPRYPERSARGVEDKTTFSEGVYVGYRWFDKQNIDPVFPFGYGLSYTHFTYSNLKVAPTQNGDFIAVFTLTNSGDIAGDEVPQVYLGAPEQKQPGEFPVRALAAFDRVHLNAGESKLVSIPIPARRFQFWNSDTEKWTVATGERSVFVGGSSRDLPLQTKITLP